MSADFDELKKSLEDIKLIGPINDALKNVSKYQEELKKKAEEIKKKQEEWEKNTNIMKNYLVSRKACSDIFDYANTLDPHDPAAIYDVDRRIRELGDIYKSLISTFGDKEKLEFTLKNKVIATIRKTDLDVMTATVQYLDQCLKSWGMHPAYKKIVNEDLRQRESFSKKYFS